MPKPAVGNPPRLAGIRGIRAALAALLASAGPLRALDLIEDFDGGAVDPAVWQATGDLAPVVADSLLTWGPGGNNWSSGDLSSVQQYFLPPAGETTSIEWTLGPNTITTQNPGGNQSIRQQIGIVSANETALRREHWTNSTGGVWLDLDNIAASNTTGAAGSIFTANDTKAPNSQGTNIGGVAITNWNWQTEARVFRLELTDTGFAWFDGDQALGGGTWAAAGIDAEFANGYRVLALGMNFDGGRGTTAVDRISILNASGPASIITSFGTTIAAPVSREPLRLSWVVDPAATVTIDRGIGSVDAETFGGIGSVRIEAPVVADPATVGYTLTAIKGAEVATRVLDLNVLPPPEPFFDDFLDHFDGDTLDAAHWEHRGDRTYSTGNSRINWDANAGNWGHGEVDSVHVFPMPTSGKPTTIIWTLGPATATAVADDGGALRPMLGIFSSFERNTWSRQHWQNTTGGVWLDVTGMTSSRPGGVNGEIYYANDTKSVDSNGFSLASFDIADWSWGTDSHRISLVLTDQDYAWWSGTNPLGSGTWEAAGLDNEFANGFKIMFMAGNWNNGRGLMSLDAIQVLNGAAVGDPFRITSVVHDAAAGTTRLTWNSERNASYALDISPDLEAWGETVDGIPSGGTTTTYTHTETGGLLYLRVRKE